MSLGPLMVDVAGTELAPGDLEVLRHPLVGDVVVHQQAMTPAHAAEQTLVVATCEPGSPSQAALVLLARETS